MNSMILLSETKKSYPCEIILNGKKNVKCTIISLLENLDNLLEIPVSFIHAWKTESLIGQFIGFTIFKFHDSETKASKVLVPFSILV